MSRIRALALAIIREGDRILVFEAHDSVKDETFYRPLGGGIEFGEYSVDALRREVREELAIEVREARLLGTTEEVFTYEGSPGHEISFVYEVEPAAPLPEAPFRVVDSPESVVVWKSLADFGHGGPPLYPAGLYELLTRTASRRLTE